MSADDRTHYIGDNCPGGHHGDPTLNPPNDPVPALSIRQPWAWALVHGGKNPENRTWPPPERLIGRRWLAHASQRVEVADLEFAASLAGLSFTGDVAVELRQLPRGAIVGSFRLDGYHHARDCRSVITDADERFGRFCTRWAADGQYHWEVADPRPLFEPLDVRGRLGVWYLPPDIAAEIPASLIEERAGA